MRRRIATSLMLAGLSLPAMAGDASGANLYQQHCIACHQPNGEGAPGIAPPISGSLQGRAKTSVGREFLAQIVVSGMIGIISSHGMRYLGNMPSFGALTDAELATVLNYVLLTFNSVELPLPVEDFAAARVRALPPAEVFKLRGRALAQSGG